MNIGSALPAESPEAAFSRPTGVRWRIVLLLVAFSFMTWFNRVSMSAAYDDRIKEQYSTKSPGEPTKPIPAISEVEMGWVYSAFLITYAIFMTPGGWFIDRFGARFALIVMGFGSAVFGAFTGLVGFTIFSPFMLWLSLMLVRSLMGIFTAPIYPASARTISQWMPLHQRAWANGMVNSAALVGIACTYVVFGKLIDWFDWPTAFLITGLVTALLAGLWTIEARDHPSQHPTVNAAEQQLILGPENGEHHFPPAQNNDRPSEPWLTLLKNRSLLFLTLSYAAVGYFQYLFFFWMHYYFEDVLDLGKAESRYYAGIPNLAMAAGMVLGGLISDRLVKAWGSRLGRAAVPVAGISLGGFFLFLGLLPNEPAWIVAWFAMAMGAVGTAEGSFWATAVEVGGQRGGSAAGIMNTGGNVGGLLAPILTPFVSKQFGWPWGIGLGSVVCVLGVVLWFWINPRERITEEE
jgi:ACS family glucarate transporter-like MFS transporter